MIVSISAGEKLENVALPCYREYVNPVDAVTWDVRVWRAAQISAALGEHSQTEGFGRP